MRFRWTRFPPASPTNATVQYNVTSAEANGTLEIVVNATSGSVAVLVLDAMNATLANVTLDASGNESVAFSDAAIGTWTVRLNFTAFNGTLDLDIVPAAPPPATNGTTNTTTTAPTTTNNDNRTGSFPLRTVDKGTPGVGVTGLVPTLLLAAAAAGLAVRRRLD